MKRILGAIRKADEAFGLIDPGDRILIGVSGGKDSLVLVHGLSLYRLFAKKDFTLIAGMLGMGFVPVETAPLTAYCTQADVPFHYRETQIGSIVFEERQESNPCSLCARMRRAELNRWAGELGCNKLALGHHSADVVETFLMNILFAGRLGTFSPLTWMDRSDIVQIRPMVYAKESHIISVARKLEVPVKKSACPVDGHTKREEVRGLIEELERRYPGAEQNLMHAIATTENYTLWDTIKRRTTDIQSKSE